MLKYLKNAEECLKLHVIVSFIHVFCTYPIILFAMHISCHVFLYVIFLCFDVHILYLLYFMNPYKILCIPKFSAYVKFSGHKILLWRDVENFVSFYVALCAPNVFVLLKLSLRSYLETSCVPQTSFLF
jgi:hypothetical protein